MNWAGLIYNGVDYSHLFKVSDSGLIMRISTNKILKQVKLKTGYMNVVVSLGKRKNILAMRVHIAVLESFKGRDEYRTQVNHIDFNKTNNNLSNLEWCTPKENRDHSYVNLLKAKKFGELNPCSKLTKIDVEYIRNNYNPNDKNFSSRALAKKYNVCHETILNVIKHKTWNFVE